MKKIASGKVREIYEIDDNTLAMVATDRISAFDIILSSAIAGKGHVLTALSAFWFKKTCDIIANHMISTDEKDFPKELSAPEFKGRTMIVKKLKMLPYEVIVRGYLFGSAWDAYQRSNEVLGYTLPKGMALAERLPSLIVTPSTKASEGHDINITFDEMAKDIGLDLAQKIKDAATRVFQRCYDHAYSRGIIIADTKFEFGLDEKGTLVLGDEVLTPDSSRFWSLKDYKTGESPKSFDKQFVRDYLKQKGLAGKDDTGPLPPDIIKKTQDLYEECLNKITAA